MSINPLSSSLNGLLGSIQRPSTDPGHGRVEQGATRPAGTSAAPAAASRQGLTSIAQPAQGTLPATAPAGTDPELWSVLTGEERAFYAKVGSMGPLTYGRMMNGGTAAAPPAMRGVRLDIKV